MTRLERLIGACAILLSMFGLAALDVDSDSLLALGSLFILGVHGLISAMMLGYPNLRPLWSERSRMYRNVLDVLLIVFLLATTGGASSHFFTYLLYPVLAGALRWGPWGAFSSALATLTAYTVFMVFALLDPLPDVPLRHLGVRFLNLTIFAGLLGYVGSPMRRGSLGEDEASLAMVLDSVADGVIISDERGQVRSANEAAARMFGTTSDELRGMPVQQLSPDLDARAILSAVEVSANGGAERVAWDVDGVRMDGSTFPAELTVGSMRVGTKRIFVAVVRDVSVRKEAEAEALRQLEVEIAQEERVLLVQDLHDGLLQTLTGAALQLKSVQSLMEQDVPGAQTRLAQVRKALAAEQRELRFWASEVKPTLLGVQGDNIEEQLQGTLERIGGTWGIGTRLRYRVTDVLPMALGQQVYRIVQEAVVNAAKHGDANSVEVDVAEGDDAIIIGVRDNGRGFPFKGSFTAEELDAQRLGPVLLKHRIAAANGRLAIESTPTGALLEITVPRGGEL